MSSTPINRLEPIEEGLAPAPVIFSTNHVGNVERRDRMLAEKARASTAPVIPAVVPAVDPDLVRRQARYDAERAALAPKLADLSEEDREARLGALKASIMEEGAP